MIDARWRVVEELGPTAHGTAFRVEDAEQGRPARLDLWDARHVAERGRLAQLERQARIVSNLQHPRCLALRQFGVEDGRPFFVTDLADGKRVADEIGSAELTVRRAMAIAQQVLEGLRHLHAHGVVHREIAPETVWLGSSLTGEAVTIGPPQLGATGSDWADSRADLHAVGRLLYAMCVGRVPAAGEAPATYPAPRSVAPDRGIGEAAERVIMRAIAPSREARFQSAEDFIAALQRMDPAQPRPKPAVPPLRKRRTHPVLLAGGAALVALVAVVAVLRGRGSSPVSQKTRPAQPAPPPAPPPAAISPPAPVAARPAPAPVPAPPTPPPVAAIPPPPPAAAPPPAPRSTEGVPPATVRAEFWELLRRGNLDAAEARIRPLLLEHPQAPWPHLARAEILFQRRWRADSVREWELALARDRDLIRGAHFGGRLCRMLDDKWDAAGADRLLELIGKEAAPLLRRCVATAETPALRSQAAQTLKRRSWRTAPR